MFIRSLISALLIPVFIFGSVLPNLCLAAEPVMKTAMTDVALNNTGALEGKVVDLGNNGLSGVPVVLHYQDRNVATTTTDKDGRFVVQDLHGGVYQVNTAQSNGFFRLWAPRTAPPVAKKQAIVYVQNPVGSGLRGILGSPIVIPAIIATAIAVPIAVSSQHHAASP